MRPQRAPSALAWLGHHSLGKPASRPHNYGILAVPQREGRAGWHAKVASSTMALPISQIGYIRGAYHLEPSKQVPGMAIGARRMCDYRLLTNLLTHLLEALIPQHPPKGCEGYDRG